MKLNLALYELGRWSWISKDFGGGGNNYFKVPFQRFTEETEKCVGLRITV